MVFRNHLGWLYFSCSIHLHHKRLLSTVYDIKTFKVASYAAVGCNCIVSFGCFSWLQVRRLFDKMPAKFIYVMLRSATSFASLMQIVFSRMHSEGFPFIVGGLGVGAVFAWLASSRHLSSSVVVVCRPLSSSSRLKFAAIGGSFCK